LLGRDIEKSLKLWLLQHVCGRKADKARLFARARKDSTGSGKVAPWMKQRPTPFEAAAIEIKQSDGRSLGPKPITKKL
jgi:hypothetical protein